MIWLGVVLGCGIAILIYWADVRRDLRIEEIEKRLKRLEGRGDT